MIEEEDYNFSKTLAWELLYRTIIDCHKLATRQSKFFLYSGNRSRFTTDDQSEVLKKARKEIEEWINSDPFYFYAYSLGFDPAKAVEGAYKVLNGSMIDTVEELLTNLSQQRFQITPPKEHENGTIRTGIFEPERANAADAAIADYCRFGAATEYHTRTRGRDRTYNGIRITPLARTYPVAAAK